MSCAQLGLNPNHQRKKSQLTSKSVFDNSDTNCFHSLDISVCRAVAESGTQYIIFAQEVSVFCL